MKNTENMTLEEALKELMRLIRKINSLEKQIDDTWGVRLVAGYIPGMVGDEKGEVNVRRGIEEIEKALGKEAKIEPYFPNTKKLRVYGVEFRQYADDKTKTFVKAGKEAPKVRIVEDDGA
jgi:hypothetical protein